MLRFSLTIIALLFCAVANASTQKVAVYLSFKTPVVRTDSKTIELKEFVHIEVAGKKNSELTKKLKRLTMQITSNTLEAKLIRKLVADGAQLNLAQIIWRGSERAQFELLLKGMQKSDVIKQVEEALRGHFSKTYRLVQLVPVVKNYRMFEKATRFEINSLAKVKAKKRVAVWVTLFSQTKKIAEVPLWFQVNVFNEVLVSIEDVDKHQTLKSEQFSLKLVDVTDSTQIYLSSDNGLEKLWAKKKIKKGTALRQKLIAKEPLVKRNQMLIVEYKVKNIFIEARGKAMNSGFLGDLIMIVVEGAKSPVKAKIIATNKVEVVVLNA